VVSTGTGARGCGATKMQVSALPPDFAEALPYPPTDAPTTPHGGCPGFR